jgi:hypothetical protein
MTPVTWLQVSYVQLLEQEKHLESVLIHNKGKIREIQQSVAYKRARNVFEWKKREVGYIKCIKDVQVMH